MDSTIKSTLLQNAHWQGNKDISKIIGIENTVLLCELVDLGIINKDQWFCKTSEELEKSTTLSYTNKRKP